MRTFTVNTDEPEPKNAKTVADMGQGEIFQMDGKAGWYRRTDEDDRPIVNIEDGYLCAPGWLSTIVTRVLAPGESLTIGPDE